MFHVNCSPFFFEQETQAECGGKKLPASRGERRQNDEFLTFIFFNTDLIFLLCSSHSSNVQGFVDKWYKSFQESPLN
jgi:hypothetical protein